MKTKTKSKIKIDNDDEELIYGMTKHSLSCNYTMRAKDLLFKKPTGFKFCTLALDSILNHLRDQNHLKSKIFSVEPLYIKQLTKEYLINKVSQDEKWVDYTNLFFIILAFSGCKIQKLCMYEEFKLSEKTFKSKEYINALMQFVEVGDNYASQLKCRNILENLISELYSQFNIIKEFPAIKRLLQGLIVLNESNYRSIRYYACVCISTIYKFLLDDLNNSISVRSLMMKKEIKSSSQLSNKNNASASSDNNTTNSNISFLNEKIELLETIIINLQNKWFFERFIDVYLNIRELMLETMIKLCHSKESKDSQGNSIQDIKNFYNTNFVVIFSYELNSHEISKRLLNDNTKHLTIKFLNFLTDKLECKIPEINQQIKSIIIKNINTIKGLILDEDRTVVISSLKVFLNLTALNLVDEKLVKLVIPLLYSNEHLIRELTAKIIFNFVYKNLQINEVKPEEIDVENEIKEKNDNKKTTLEMEVIEKSKEVSINLQNFVNVLNYFQFFTANDNNGISLCFDAFYNLNKDLLTNVNLYFSLSDILIKNLLKESVDVLQEKMDSLEIKNLEVVYNIETTDLFQTLMKCSKLLVKKFNKELTNQVHVSRVYPLYSRLLELVFNNSKGMIYDLAPNGYVEELNCFIEFLLEIDFDFIGIISKGNSLIFNKKNLEILIDITQELLTYETDDIKENVKLVKYGTLIINKIIKIQETHNINFTGSITNNTNSVNINNDNDSSNFKEYLSDKLIGPFFSNSLETLFNKEYFNIQIFNEMDIGTEIENMIKYIRHELRINYLLSFSDSTKLANKNVLYAVDSSVLPQDIQNIFIDIFQYGRIIYVVKEFMLNCSELSSSKLDNTSCIRLSKFTFALFKILSDIVNVTPKCYSKDYVELSFTCLEFIESLNIKILNSSLDNLSKTSKITDISSSKAIKTIVYLRDFTFQFLIENFKSINAYFRNSLNEFSNNNIFEVRQKIISILLCLIAFYSPNDNLYSNLNEIFRYSNNFVGTVDTSFNESNDQRELIISDEVDRIINSFVVLSIDKDIVNMIKTFIEDEIILYFYNQKESENKEFQNDFDENLESKMTKNKEDDGNFTKSKPSKYNSFSPSCYENEKILKSNACKVLFTSFNRMFLLNKNTLIKHKDLCTIYFESFILCDFLPLFIRQANEMMMESILEMEILYYDTKLEKIKNIIDNEENTTFNEYVKKPDMAPIIMFYISNAAIKLHQYTSSSLVMYTKKLDSLNKIINESDNFEETENQVIPFELREAKAEYKKILSQVQLVQTQQLQIFTNLYYKVLKKIKGKFLSALHSESFLKDKDFFILVILNLIDLALKKIENPNYLKSGETKNKQYLFNETNLLNICLQYLKKNVFLNVEDYKFLIVKTISLFEEAEATECLTIENKTFIDKIKKYLFSKSNLKINKQEDIVNDSKPNQNKNNFDYDEDDDEDDQEKEERSERKSKEKNKKVDINKSDENTNDTNIKGGKGKNNKKKNNNVKLKKVDEESNEEESADESYLKESNTKTKTNKSNKSKVDIKIDKVKEEISNNKNRKKNKKSFKTDDKNENENSSDEKNNENEFNSYDVCKNNKKKGFKAK